MGGCVCLDVPAKTRVFEHFGALGTAELQGMYAKALQSSRGRGSGFAGPQAQRPPLGAGRYAKRATVGVL
jgi:hypothetical protein